MELLPDSHPDLLSLRALCLAPNAYLLQPAPATAASNAKPQPQPSWATAAGCAGSCDDAGGGCPDATESAESAESMANGGLPASSSASSSASASVSAGGDVCVFRVRPYRAEDLRHVRLLFEEGMLAEDPEVSCCAQAAPRGAERGQGGPPPAPAPAPAPGLHVEDCKQNNLRHEVTIGLDGI